MSFLYTGTDDSDAGRIYYFDTNHDAGKITSITDGLNNTTQLNYQLLTYPTDRFGTKNFYTIGTGCTYPYTDIIPPISCVNRVVCPDGKGGSSTTEYSYGEAKAHLFKGFLGFLTQNVQNTLTNKKVVTNITWNYPNCFPSKQTEITTALSTNAGISKSESFFNNSMSGKVYQSKLSKNINTDIIGDLTKTTEYTGLDIWGNQTGITTTIGDLIETQAISYGNFGAWCPNKPVSITATRQQNGESFVRSTEYEYDTKGNLTKQTIDPADVNKVVTHYSNFDNYGHARQVDVTANNSTRSTTVTYLSGRFVKIKTNVLGEVISYDWDETRSLLKSETGRLGTTSYSYDEMGRLTKTDHP